MNFNSVFWKNAILAILSCLLLIILFYSLVNHLRVKKIINDRYSKYKSNPIVETTIGLDINGERVSTYQEWSNRDLFIIETCPPPTAGGGQVEKDIMYEYFFKDSLGKSDVVFFYAKNPQDYPPFRDYDNQEKSHLWEMLEVIFYYNNALRVGVVCMNYALEETYYLTHLYDDQILSMSYSLGSVDYYNYKDLIESGGYWAGGVELTSKILGLYSSNKKREDYGYWENAIYMDWQASRGSNFILSSSGNEGARSELAYPQKAKSVICVASAGQDNYGVWTPNKSSTPCLGQLYAAIVDGSQKITNGVSEYNIKGTSVSTARLAAIIAGWVQEGKSHQKILKIFTPEGCQESGRKYIQDYGCLIK